MLDIEEQTFHVAIETTVLGCLQFFVGTSLEGLTHLLKIRYYYKEIIISECIEDWQQLIRRGGKNNKQQTANNKQRTTNKERKKKRKKKQTYRRIKKQ